MSKEKDTVEITLDKGEIISDYYDMDDPTNDEHPDSEQEIVIKHK